MGPGTVVSNLDPFIKIAMKYAAVCPLNIMLGVGDLQYLQGFPCNL